MKSECNKCANNLFYVGHEVFECNEAKLGLQMGVFTQMSPRMAKDCVSKSPYWRGIKLTCSQPGNSLEHRTRLQGWEDMFLGTTGSSVLGMPAGHNNRV
jgi:hypothetical protein